MLIALYGPVLLQHLLRMVGGVHACCICTTTIKAWLQGNYNMWTNKQACLAHRNGSWCKVKVYQCIFQLLTYQHIYIPTSYAQTHTHICIYMLKIYTPSGTTQRCEFPAPPKATHEKQVDDQHKQNEPTRATNITRTRVFVPPLVSGSRLPIGQRKQTRWGLCGGRPDNLKN